ncbi:MAG: thiamine diphosphokinase [Oscillospiraceae bacterium]|nr:thiamine diphosphokinase [Oscillospiraceae bacterium]
MGEQRKTRAVLIGAAPGQRLDYLLPMLREDDFVICADGGRNKADSAGIKADWYVGDNDSGGSPEGLPCTILPSEKDVTDMEMAIDQAFALGYREMLLAGCTGGREDHHVANLGLLEQIWTRGGVAVLVNEENEVRFLSPGSYQIENEPAFYYLSLLPLDAVVSGVTLRGTKYELTDAQIRRGTTLAVSNEILQGKTAEIAIESGCALLIRSQRMTNN